MVGTSTRQRLCFWQEPIPGTTSEQGAAHTALSFLRRMDRGHEMVQLLTFDAGFLFHEFLVAVRKTGRHWLGTLKDNQPGLLAEARRRRCPTRNSIPEYETPMVKDHGFYRASSRESGSHAPRPGLPGRHLRPVGLGPGPDCRRAT